jgi:Tfp pilus assembly protein FimT
MLAAIALPSVRAVDDQGLDTTAAWVAETVRFARSEAVRTGRPVYVEVDRDTDRMLVAEANLAGPTAAAGATLRDPITKQPLDVVLSSAAAFSRADVSTQPFTYAAGADARVVFSAQGVPFRKASGVSERMTLGKITLRRGTAQRSVLVERVTGRVSVQ